MPKKIRISGEIGWMVLSADILKDIDDANGEDLDIEIASPGGSVFAGIEISNGIRNYKKRNPNAQILITITGLAASMASYIAALDMADLVAAYDNAIGMYHNPWNFAVGDYREMKKNGEMLEGLTRLLAKAYEKRSGKSRAEIEKLMDDETWLFGEELKEYGFVDEIIKTDDSEDPENKTTAIATAKAQFREMVEHAKQHEESAEKVAALVREVVGSSQGILDDSNKNQNAKPGVTGTHIKTPATTGKGETLVDMKELQSKHPDIYAETVAVGEKREKERVAALMAMKQEKAYQGISAVQEVIDDAIKDGKSKDETVGLVLATFHKNTSQAEAENPPDFDASGSAQTATGEVDKGENGFESMEEV